MKQFLFRLWLFCLFVMAGGSNNASARYTGPDQLRREIFFLQSVTKVSKYEYKKIEDVARYCIDHPACKITIDGYAEDEVDAKDKENDSIQQILSEKRCESVKKIFIEEYGIDEKRLIVKGHGRTVRPFPVAPKNRCVIITVCE